MNNAIAYERVSSGTALAVTLTCTVVMRYLQPTALTSFCKRARHPDSRKKWLLAGFSNVRRNRLLKCLVDPSLGAPLGLWYSTLLWIVAIPNKYGCCFYDRYWQSQRRLKITQGNLCNNRCNDARWISRVRVTFMNSHFDSGHYVLGDSRGVWQWNMERSMTTS